MRSTAVLVRPEETAVTPSQNAAACVLFTVGSIWAIGALKETRPRDLALWFGVLGVAQVAAGELLRRKSFDRNVPVVRSETGGWPWAFAAFAGLQAAQYAVAVHTLGPKDGWPAAASELFRYTCLVALPEEIWFRGIWPAAMGNRFGASVIGGSVLFGLYHLPHGLSKVALTGSIGLVFAAARHRGAGIVPLTIAHGLMDWLNMQMVPGVRFRVPPTVVSWLFPLLCVLAAIWILLFGKKKGISDQTTDP